MFPDQSAEAENKANYLLFWAFICFFLHLFERLIVRPSKYITGSK